MNSNSCMLRGSLNCDVCSLCSLLSQNLAGLADYIYSLVYQCCHDMFFQRSLFFFFGLVWACTIHN